MTNENLEKRCEHKFVFPIGFQEGIPKKGILGFPMGNCLGCETSLDMINYVPMNNIWYKYQDKMVHVYRIKYEGRRR